MCLSNIFEIVGKTEIGRYLFGYDSSSPLKRGFTLAFLRLTGKISVDMQLFIITDIGFVIKSSHNFNSFGTYTIRHSAFIIVYFFTHMPYL